MRTTSFIKSRAAILLAAVIIVSGCSLPRSGPNKSEIMKGAWASYRADKWPTFRRTKFALHLRNAWHTAKSEAGRLPLQTRAVRTDRRILELHQKTRWNRNDYRAYAALQKVRAAA